MIVENGVLYPTPPILAKKGGKSTRVLIEWRSKFIHLATLTFVGDHASFYFASAFHNAKRNNNEMEIGFLSSKDLPNNIFPPDKKANLKGTHISLHPKGQVMHMRENEGGQILASRKMKWYPVMTPFNLLHLFSPPLVECVETTRTSGFINKVPNEYEQSVQLKVDIFPRYTKIHNPEFAIYENWGISPNYLVRTSIILPKVNTPALIIWPHTTDLSL